MPSKHHWTPEERAALASFYPYVSAQKLTELIPKRSPQAIRERGVRDGLRKCQDRLKEMGRENNTRWKNVQVFKEPEPPST